MLVSPRHHEEKRRQGGWVPVGLNRIEGQSSDDRLPEPGAKASALLPPCCMSAGNFCPSVAAFPIRRIGCGLGSPRM